MTYAGFGTLKWHTRLVAWSQYGSFYIPTLFASMDLRTELMGWESDHPAHNCIPRLFWMPKFMIFWHPKLDFVDILSIPGFPRLQVLDSQDLDDQKIRFLRIHLENPPGESPLRIPLENPPSTIIWTNKRTNAMVKKGFHYYLYNYFLGPNNAVVSAGRRRTPARYSPCGRYDEPYKSGPSSW